MRRLLWAAGAGLGLVAILIAAFLGLAHLEIRRLDPPLPTPGDLLAAPLAEEHDLPLRLGWIDTARQRLPTSQVLALEAGEADPPFAMSHPAFVIEWSDGRIFLFDLGMDAASAVAFGTPLEALAGAEPIEPLGSVAARLGGEALGRVAAVAFSHLHMDHVSGVDALCQRVDRRLRWVRTRSQAERDNFTTRAARALLEQSRCLEPETLEAAALARVPGFPGLSLFEAAGHTPGSQVAAVQLRRDDVVETWVLAGDVANHMRGVREDRDKPLLYRLFVVPEAPARLGRVRRLLLEVEREPRGHVVLAHDAEQLRASGLPEYGR